MSATRRRYSDDHTDDYLLIDTDQYLKDVVLEISSGGVTVQALLAADEARKLGTDILLFAGRYVQERYYETTGETVLSAEWKDAPTLYFSPAEGELIAHELPQDVGIDLAQRLIAWAGVNTSEEV
jgi:hypothetical protein